MGSGYHLLGGVSKSAPVVTHHVTTQHSEHLRAGTLDDCYPCQQSRPQVKRKTVCPPLSVRWLALHCASEGCSGGPSRSSSQEDEPWQIIGKHLSESMLRS